MLGGHSITPMLGTTNANRARQFYEKRLGLRLIEEDGFALTFDVNGLVLRISKVRTLQPEPFTVLGWTVPDIRKTLQALKEVGVSFERFPGMDQDPLGIWTAPSKAQVAWFKDPDGNVLSLTQLT